MKIKAKDILPFLGFFLITIGNGKYLGAKFGDLIEYLGIVVLLILCYWPSKTNHVSITETIKVLLLTLLLSIGAFIKGAPTKACYMIALTSFALMSFALKSQSVLSTNKRIKIAANAIFSGAVFSALIGSITGTLGLTLGSDESIVGILYVSGFQVKNYCGGIWMLLFVLNYIYFKRTNRINTKRSVYTLCAISIFLILSGSKGACVLCVLFVLGVNYNKIVSLKKEQKKVFGVIFGAILILMAIYLYNNILINIKTYAYRMRGFQNLLDYMLDDSKRLMFGISDIAYADNGNTYVNNIRSFLGWEASVEMAHVNILIKNGLLGVFPYIMIYKSYISEKKYLNSVDKSILLALIILMLISGFVETYIVSIHYVVGPEMTDNNGLSCIVCHSPKGKNLYNEIIKDVNWKKMSFDDLIKYNSNYNKSAPMGERRESFWDEYNVLDKKELFAKYCSPQEIPTNNNIVKKIVEGFKRIIGVKL